MISLNWQFIFGIKKLWNFPTLELKDKLIKNKYNNNIFIDYNQYSIFLLLLFYFSIKIPKFFHKKIIKLYQLKNHEKIFKEEIAKNTEIVVGVGRDKLIDLNIIPYVATLVEANVPKHVIRNIYL
jgi:hypothetical protein